MMRGMFAAISGLKQHQVMLDVTANDIANVNTIGYKSSRVTFQDSLTQMQRGASGPTTNNGGSNAAQVGLGVGLGSVDNLMTGGAMQTTGNPLDVAIQGDGFFQIGSGAPTDAAPGITPTAYTRAGNFSINSEGYLTTQTGQYVIGCGHAGGPGLARHRDQDPGRRHRHRDRPDGGVSYVDPGTGLRVTPLPPDAGDVLELVRPRARGRQPVGRLGQLGPEDRQHAGHGGLGVTNAGAIEMSNVDLAQTFTNMITAQRGFQANSRVISTADEMLQDLVNLKR